MSFSICFCRFLTPGSRQYLVIKVRSATSVTVIWLDLSPDSALAVGIRCFLAMCSLSSAVYPDTCVCVYVCMYVYMLLGNVQLVVSCVSRHLRMCVCMHVCICASWQCAACRQLCIQTPAYVCMYVCVYVCMYMCFLAMCSLSSAVYPDTCVCVYVCMYVCMYACMYVFMYMFFFEMSSLSSAVYTETHVRMYACIYVCMYTCFFTICSCVWCLYTHTYTRIHMYTHANSYLDDFHTVSQGPRNGVQRVCCANEKHLNGKQTSVRT
jgi:hypothetical protein